MTPQKPATNVSGAAPRHLLLADAHLHQCECGDWHSGVFLREQAEAASAAGAAVNVDVERLAAAIHSTTTHMRSVFGCAQCRIEAQKIAAAYNAPATPEQGPMDQWAMEQNRRRQDGSR